METVNPERTSPEKQKPDIENKETVSVNPDPDEAIPVKPDQVPVVTMTRDEKRMFYKSLFSPIGELSQELKDKAATELRESESGQKESISNLRKMIAEKASTPKGEPVSKHFSEENDECMIRFLRTKKYDVARTYEMMEAYVGFRGKYQSITDLLNFDGVKDTLAATFPAILPVKDNEGRVVITFEPGIWDMEKVSFDQMVASTIFLLENLVINEENQIRGFVFLETYEKFNIAQALKFKSADIKKLFDLMQGAFPGRFKAFHVVKQPWYFSVVMALAKPFMGKKVTSRMFIHGEELKGLFESIKPEYLAPSFGGIGEKYDPQPMIEELEEAVKQRNAHVTVHL